MLERVGQFVARLRDELAAVGLCDRLLQRAPRRLGGGEPVGEMRLHRPDTLDVVIRVQAEPPVGAVGVEQAVPLLPGTEELDARVGASAQLADPQMSGLSHGITVQHLDKNLTSANQRSLIS